MVKRIVVPMVFLLVWNLSSAQRFNGGVLAGFNGTQVEGDTFKGYNKPGILAGLYVETDVAPAIFLAMELKYSQKGARNRPTQNQPQKYIMRLDYIDLPVYMAFRTSDRGSLLAGVSTGYLFHSQELDNQGELPTEDQHAFNTIDLQPFIGFQFDFLERVKADLRFAFSALPIRGQPGENATNYYWLNNQFNNVISLALYYQFGR